MEDGTVWEGDFKNGKRDGLIKETRKDGTTEEFECKEGEPHGFSSYRSSDGSVLLGYYWHGLLHGLVYRKYIGEHYKLYENDKHVRKFTVEEVAQINAGKLDWTMFFNDPTSKINMIKPQTFHGPADWEQRVDAVLKKVQAVVDSI